MPQTFPAEAGLNSDDLLDMCVAIHWSLLNRADVSVLKRADNVRSNNACEIVSQASYHRHGILRDDNVDTPSRVVRSLASRPEVAAMMYRSIEIAGD